MNKKISKQNLIEEEKSFNEIKKHIDKNNCFIFDAGAGSGKTYTLIQSLKYILQKYGESLKNHKQKILCVTYTNVAAKEIKERLGNTNIVIVSTIHDFLWNEIQFYQKELIEIHKGKLEEEINKSEEFLKKDNDSIKYREIPDNQLFLFRDMLFNDEEKYHKYYSKPAADFKAQLNDIVEAFPNIIKNVNAFKKIANNIFKIKNYQTTLENIKLKKKKNINNKIDYTKVIYNSRRNIDRLSNMEFSHDTLIEYSEKLIIKYEPLQKIICNKYPYILIDEYQDTMESVVNIMCKLSTFSNNKIVIGYYGDKKQNIYDKGVGCRIFDIHKNLKTVLKEYNRRSTPNIIAIGNSIRNDNIQQKTIYENYPNGSVSFYQGKNVELFIEYHKKEWNITIENPINCLCLKNEDVAERSGFGKFYEFFKNTPYYKRNYKFLREHILSKELEKLGDIQLLLFRFIDFKSKIDNPKTLITEIIDKKIVKDLNINELREFIKTFSYIKGKTFFQIICYIFAIIKTCQNNKISDSIKFFIGIDKMTSIEDLKDFMISKLFDNIEEEKEIEKQKENIINFLNQDYSLFLLWYNYITDNTKTEIYYHTFHGTKGLEFQNVLIILDSNFGVEKNFFSNLLKKINIPSQNDDDKIKAARNLLYVATTRAITNLSILYTDTIDIEQEKNITNIFGKINKI